MVNTIFFQNISRDYESDTTTSEDEKSPTHDIVAVTPPAGTVLRARLRERITHSEFIVNLRQLFTRITLRADLRLNSAQARHHQALVSSMKQKIVFKVFTDCDLCGFTYRKIARRFPGVMSVKLGGEASDLLSITGTGIDVIHIAESLRKKLGFSGRRMPRLISVVEKEDKKTKYARG